MILLAYQGHRAPAIAQELRAKPATVRVWLKRFNADGIRALFRCRHDRPRGRRPTYTGEQLNELIAVALTPPEQLGLPFDLWTLNRLEAYLHEVKGMPIRRSRIQELLHAYGVDWRPAMNRKPWGTARHGRRSAATPGE
jgi:transposase